ncbi:MAG: leucyl/phenylalanyl-tRNA--protein transferase [SAR116 cluster bacterium]|nr:leucyl/phenylalanyl-tRNA--protein transferase [SAR116 cluster bacterium]RCL79307.1 MAG: leucyl/phenylalanyl-tRNA--protein transferase [SAR116 cluster bacterium]CAI8346001.1 MAG: Leucyl/phenylalanyl-tRNA--protein transferase [SAR116 cluster bacterium]
MSQQFVIAPETIIQAYTLGIFPMAASKDAEDIQFFQPDIRGVLPIRPPHIPKRLQRLLRKQPFEIHWNQNFPAVIDGCAAPRSDTQDTWINPQIRRLYISLHMLGFAHSVEVYEEGQLVGGLYGVAIGGAFFGESMFSRVSNASKIALCHLMARLRYGNFKLLDAQFVNDHLIQFGIESIDKDDFQKQLEHAINSKASLDLDVPESIILQSLWQDNNVTS